MKKIYIEDISKKPINSTIIIRAWITEKREHKNVLFIDISDSTGSIQAIAHKENFSEEKIEELKRSPIESTIEIKGVLKENKEFNITEFKILNKASFQISPSPRQDNFNPFDKKYFKQLVRHPTFYIRNPKIAAVLKIKSRFKYNLQKFFWDKGFVQIETPIMTKQTLYDDSGAFWVNFNGEKVSLSRCATFHLEPSIIAYEKVFSVTDSFANEKSRSDRHLAEYAHLKVELAWTNIKELKELAGKTYYEVAKMTIKDCEKEIKLLGLEKEIDKRLDKINPLNHKAITYDEAIKILHEKNVEIKYGKSLSSKDEKILTKHFGESFLWIGLTPCSAEGFPFKRKKDALHLTITSDLIAPEGYGEILGIAEKITSKKELLERMKEKGKDSKDQLKRYRDYIDLRNFGLPEHGGIGMGIERAVRYLLNIPHIRFTRPFPAMHGTKINH